jgi:hypothetical protein
LEFVRGKVGWDLPECKRGLAESQAVIKCFVQFSYRWNGGGLRTASPYLPISALDALAYGVSQT